MIQATIEEIPSGFGETDLLVVVGHFRPNDPGRAEATALCKRINELLNVHSVPPPNNEKMDVLVNVGDMSEAVMESVVLDAGYESMVEDILQNFNWIVSQGIKPMTALFAMAQAFAIALGCCLRANLPWATAQRLLKMIMKTAKDSEKLVRVITKQ